MEKQFEYLIKVAKEYKVYENDDQALFEALQGLDQDRLTSIYDEYGDSGRKYQPVNMLRAEVAGRLLNGENITPNIVEEIKEIISDKKREELKHLPDEQLDKMEASSRQTNAFMVWTRYWPLFYTS